MRVLLVEPDAINARAASLGLTQAGFKVLCAADAEDGLDLAKHYEPDAIVCEADLSDGDGLRFVRDLRTAQLRMAVIMLHVRPADDWAAEIAALDAGADDYLRKPLHLRVLAARLRALIRRAGGHVSSVIRVGDVEVDLAEKIVAVRGRGLRVTGREYQILELMALRAGRTLTKEMFFNHMYGGLDEPEPKIIDVFVCRLRRKLEIAGASGHLQTVWGRGYRLQAPDREDAAA